MKNILIVVPGCKTGGVTSSLIALLNSPFVNRYKVDLFIMNTFGEKLNPVFASYSIGKNLWTSLLYANVIYSKGLRKIILIFFKLLLRIPFIGKKIISQIENVTIRNLEKKNYDCVISFQENTSLPFVAKFSNHNKVAWIHCDYSRIFTNKDNEMAIFSQYSKIITVSEYTKQTFCQLMPLLSHKVYTIYNIMDITAIIKKAKEPINNINFNNKTFTIISVGRISAIKQFEVIPSIAHSLKARGLKFKWYILGGVHEQIPYQNLQKSIIDYKVTDYVFCLGNQSNPYPYFKHANLLVSTSKSEACPMIFNEAKILNLPIVTNDFGSAYEFINDGQDGRICPINQMADIIENIITNNSKFNPIISDKFNSQTIQNQLDFVLMN